MRLHRLSLCGIGPFVGEVEIDFARLGESGLFLLEGPTGSGKSTIIDAVTFALYGKVAQASASAERLRSHHPAATGDSWVELVFETHNGIYLIRRTPTFERPKRDGGVRKVNTTVKIWRLTSPDAPIASEPLSTRVSEADDEITRAVGLTHAQFVQTVVLPQGEFANFLRSKTEDKKALLQRLFGTEVIAATQQRLIDGRRAAEQQRAAAETEVRKALQAFAGAARLDEATGADLDAAVTTGEPGAISSVIDRLLAERAERAADTEAAFNTAVAEQRAASTALEGARDVRRRQLRKTELDRRLEALVTRRADADNDRQRLDAALRAAQAMAPAQALAASITRSDQLQDQLSAARAELPTALRSADQPALRDAAASAQTLIGSLADAAEREGQLARRGAQLAELGERVLACQAAIDADHHERAALPNRIEQFESERALATELAAREGAVLAEHQRAEQRLAAAEQAERAARAFAQEAQITQEAVAAWDAQNEKLLLLRRSWRAGVAGELGIQLIEGDPCVVCGSVEHPAPAQPAVGHVSQQALDGAEAESRRLQSAVETARAELTRQRVELEALQLKADSLTPMQARTTLDELALSLAETRAAGTQRDQLAAKLTEARRQYDRLGASIAKSESELAALRARTEELESRTTEDAAVVERARDGHPSVLARIDTVERELAAQRATADAIQLADEAIARAVECGERFRDVLRTTGFADESEWQSALATDLETRELRAAVEAFDREWATLTAQLADPELNDPALANPAPQLEPLESALLAAEALAAEQGSLAGAARDRLAGARQHAQTVDRALQANAALLAASAAAVRLGNLAAGVGDNQLRMDLTTFVLIQRFADVVSAANGQLRRVSGGRYELEHTDAKSGNAKSGLGLRVLDLHTGKPRDPATLSGGETFYVSLALALGLADVVRSESGGIDLGTLFIDEGFGSLDPQVLDEVLAVLDTLRAGGRAVGVVSHVGDLKSRIPERISVGRRPDGSSGLAVVA